MKPGRFWIVGGTSAGAEAQVHEQQRLPVFHISAPTVWFMSQPLQPEGFLLVHSASATTRKGKACLSASLFLFLALAPVPSPISGFRLFVCQLMLVSLDLILPVLLFPWSCPQTFLLLRPRRTVRSTRWAPHLFPVIHHFAPGL